MGRRAAWGIRAREPPRRSPNSTPPRRPPARRSGHPRRPKPTAPVRVAADGLEIEDGERILILFEAGRCIHAQVMRHRRHRAFQADMKGPCMRTAAMAPKPGWRTLTSVPWRHPLSAQGRTARGGGGAGQSGARSRGRALRHAPRAYDRRRCGRISCYPAAVERRSPSRSATVPSTGSALRPPASRPIGKTDALDRRKQRSWPAIDPQADGPLVVRGNLEIISGTGGSWREPRPRACAPEAAAPTSPSATGPIPASASRPADAGFRDFQAENGGQVQPLLAGAVDGDVVAGVGVAHDAGGRVVPEHALEPPGRAPRCRRPTITMPACWE